MAVKLQGTKSEAPRAERGRSVSRTALVGVSSLLLAASLTGCGGSSASSSNELLGAPRARSSTTTDQPIAVVGGTPIAMASFEHWLSVTSNLSASVNSHSAPKPPQYTACIAGLEHPKTKQTAAQLKAKCEAQYVQMERQALGYLISSDWVRAEAANLHLAVSEEEAHERLEELKEKDFPKSSEFHKFLASSGETMSDLLGRVKSELLDSKISESLTKGKTQTTEADVLMRDFDKAFEARWRSRTTCAQGFVMEDCSEYKPPAHATPTPAAKAQANTERVRRGEAGANYSGTKTVSGETYNTPGGMSLISPAFERNGSIPAAYTCEEAGISPPLQWEKVPSSAKSLVLFVIDQTEDSFTNPNGGVRWLVANIDPSSTGVAAGKLPSGAVVGKGNSGKTGYGPICATKGKTDQIEFLIYALKQKVKVKPGFTEQEVESQYGAKSNAVIGSVTDYAQFTRAG